MGVHRVLHGMTLRLLAALLVLVFHAAHAASSQTSLASDGAALMPVIISANASAETKVHAAELADYLGRIAGAKFLVQSGDGASGIAVGRAGDFPALKAGVDFVADDPLRREEYLLRSHARGLWILGASDMSVQDAVWDLLYRLGYRQFFPTKNWEVIPTTPRLAISVDAFERPSYCSRRFSYGWGPADFAVQTWADWCARNRVNNGFALITNHSYGGIIARHKAEFAAHPEFLGLLDGQRSSTKFCISNPGLRRLVAADAVRQLEEQPSGEVDSLSIEPSDGSHWCECAECAKLGSITDRALLLANEVAAAVEAKFPHKYVGMLAYNEHSTPPSLAAHPHVIVNVATAFIKGGHTLDQVIAGWSPKVKMFGIREYLGVMAWDHDMPGKGRGANTEYLSRTITGFYAKGARFYGTEADDNWGCNGLGYYLAARMLWDIREADHLDELTTDFIEKCFGAARAPMRKFYELIDGKNKPMVSDDLIGRMYRLLDEARALADSDATRARLDDLDLYTRYVEMRTDYVTASGSGKQAAFEAFLRHVWRMRRTEMVHAKAVFEDRRKREDTLKMPEGSEWRVPVAKSVWKREDEPFTRDELDGFVRNGIATRTLLAFTPVSFSDDLVPATKLALPDVKEGQFDRHLHLTRHYYTWVEKAPAVLKFSASAGWVYQNRGGAKMELYPAAEAEMKSVAQAEIAPDKEDHAVEFSSPFTGLHRIAVTDQGAGSRFTGPEGTPLTLCSSFEEHPDFAGSWTLYFYVPRGTKTVGGFSENSGTLRDARGRVAATFEKRSGFFNVPVEPGDDGKLWKFERCAGDKLLMTVPPFLARSGQELLLPKEVVERDAAR